MDSSDAEDEFDSTQTLTYYRNYSDEDTTTLSIQYYGIASTEYNPEYWAETAKVMQKSGTNWQGPDVELEIPGSAATAVTLTANGVQSGYKAYAPVGYSIVSVSGSSDVTKAQDGSYISFDANGDYTLTLTFALKTKKVFGGWSVQTESGWKEYLPGDVLPYSSSTRAVKTIWIEPDLFVKRPSKTITYEIPGNAWSESRADLPDIYALNNIYVAPYYEAPTYESSGKVLDFRGSTLTNGVPKAFLGANSEYIVGWGDGRTTISMYGTIYHIDVSKAFNSTKNSITFKAVKIEGGTQLPAGTYRQSGGQVTFQISGGVGLVGNVVLDNIGMCAGGSLGTHGGNTNCSILANGKILIIGTGIHNPALVNGVKTRGEVAPQLFGGSGSSATTSAIETNKEMPFGSQSHIESDSYPLTTNIATCVIVHSGVFNNVVGGGQGGAIGDTGSSPLLSTYLVLKGGWVIDTVVGGSHSNNVYAAKYDATHKITSRTSLDGSTWNNDYTTDEWSGGTFVYALGVNMPGDTWQDIRSGHATAERLKFNNQESTVIEGGGHTGCVYGTTHVFVSDEADVWDAQAGGRQAKSFCNGTYLEISGKAVVRHTACGTITDASTSNSHSVNQAKVCVCDDAQIANVYGAGYDTWENPKGISMMKGRIEVTIHGGTIYNVFGGGYRGTIGVDDSNAASKVDVNVTIKGGTVLGDVFGGGSGGVDKLKHNSNGTVFTPNGAGNGITTGSSRINGAVHVAIEGGTVCGNVYGGGMSVPNLASYNGQTTISGDGQTKTIDMGLVSNVAAVKGTVDIKISGGTVRGDVYGGGKGIEITSSDEVVKDYTGNCVLLYNSSTKQYSPGTIPFFTDSSGNYSYQYCDATHYDKNKQQNPSTWVNAYRDYAKIDGAVTVEMSGGTVEGNVYGGGALGRVYGDICVFLHGGRVIGSVYGGGLGTVGNLSVTGKRRIIVAGDFEVQSSIYGGSALGTDGYEKTVKKSGKIEILGFTDPTYDGRYDALIYIKAGSVYGSVFGGGFKGITYGNTHVYIGQNSVTLDPDSVMLDIDPAIITKLNSLTNTEVTIEESIYLGGDVGEIASESEAYTQVMVQGTGELYIDDPSGDKITISGSIMGAGNSCLTGKDTSVYIRNLKSSVAEAIHRATEVTLVNCDITLNGRATIENTLSGVNDTSYSLYLIDKLNLRNGTTLGLSGSIDYVSQYFSQNANGDITIPSAPVNKIVLGGGKIFTLRETDGDYGVVNGYTIISTRSDQQSYGALALGHPESPGGFVVLKSGSFVKADFSDLSETCRCWYLAGAINNEVTFNVKCSPHSTASDSLSVLMPSLQSGSKYRYTGGIFIPDTPGSVGYFDDGTAPSLENKFRIKFGYNGLDPDTELSFNDGAGLFVKNDFGSVDPSIGTAGDGHSLIRNPVMNISIESGISEFRYLGYAVIYINEVVQVTDGVTPSYIVINSIQTKIHIYTESDSLSNSVLDISIIEGKGVSTFIIPAGYAGYGLVVDSITPTGGAYGVSSFYLSSSKNIDNTPGWTDNLGAKTIRADGLTYKTLIGTLQGGYPASLMIQVNSFTASSEETYDAVMRIVDGEDTILTINLQLKVAIVSDVIVTFKVTENLELKYPYPYGTVISLPDCPPTEDHFVGWYTDADFNNPYSFTIPLTADMTLYARYMFEITFDYMDGTSSKFYVKMPSGYIGAVNPPSREGYTFGGWFTDAECTDPWDTEHNLVTNDMTLYAYWIGWNVKVLFKWVDTEAHIDKYVDLDPEHTNAGALAQCQIIEFGTRFDSEAIFHLPSGTDRNMPLLSWAQLMLQEDDDFSEKHYKFIYWTYAAGTAVGSAKNIAVYTDTPLLDVNMLLKEGGSYVKDGDNYIVVLTALASHIALNITMDSSVIIDGQPVDNLALVDPPTSFLIFPVTQDGSNPPQWYKMEIELNGASRPGYSLEGWSIATPDSSIAVFPERAGPGTIVIPEYSAGSVITLKIVKNDDVDYPYIGEFYTGDILRETMNITELGRQMMFGDVETMFTLKFQSEWEQIPYTVTIAEQAHGVIFATYGAQQTRFTSGTFYYGDTIMLLFTPDSGYDFHHWYSSGEGLFNDYENISTTFVVQGDTTISAYMTGPQIVRIYIEYEGLYVGNSIKGEIPDLYWKDEDENKNYFTKSVSIENNGGHTLVLYAGTATLGEHAIYLEGRQFGDEYDLKMPIISTTSHASYYIMTAKSPLPGASNVVGEAKHDVPQNAYFIVTDVNKKEAVLTLVDNVSNAVVNIGSTVTDTATGDKYTITGIGSTVLSHSSSLSTLEVLKIADNAVYRHGYIDILVNDIDDGRKGVISLTEYLPEYYLTDAGGANTNISITLKEGYFQYTYDEGGDPIEVESTNLPATGTITGALSDRTIHGIVIQKQVHLDITYGKTAPPPGTADYHSTTPVIYYGDDYHAELTKYAEVPDPNKWLVYAWYLNNSGAFTLINSSIICTANPDSGPVYIYGMYVESNETATIYQRVQQLDGTYLVTTTESVVDSTGAIYYYCADAMNGYASEYSLDDTPVDVEALRTKTFAESTPISNPILQITPGENKAIVISYNFLKARFTITDANGTRDVELEFSAVIELVHRADTDTQHYDKWIRTTGASSGTVEVPIDGYVVSFEDVQYCAANPSNRVIIADDWSIRLYDVDLITARAEIQSGSTNYKNHVTLHLPYDSPIVRVDNITVRVNGVEYELYNYTDYEKYYDIANSDWVFSHPSVRGDMTISYLWVPMKYEVRVVADGNTSVSGTSGTTPVSLLEVVYNVDSITVHTADNDVKFVLTRIDNQDCAMVYYIPDGVVVGDTVTEGSNSYHVITKDATVKSTSTGVKFIVTNWWRTNGYPGATVIEGSAALNSKITQGGGERTISAANLGYGSIFRLSLVFSGSYTLDSNSSSYINPKDLDHPYNYIPKKQSSMQEFVLQFFITGDVEITIGTVWIGDRITFAVQNTDGGSFVLEPSMTIMVGHNEVVYLRISDYEYKDFLYKEGYYFDGWYNDMGFTEFQEVAYNDQHELCFKIKGGNKFYARYVKVPYGNENYDLVYDGTEQFVDVKPEINAPLDISAVDFDDGGAHSDSISITNYDDTVNHHSIGYSFTPRKAYPMVVDGEVRYIISDVNHVYSGTFTLNLMKRPVYVFADSGIWAYDGTYHSAPTYKVFGEVSYSSVGNVSVTGTIKNNGVVANHVTVTGSSSNYDVIPVDGTLMVYGASSAALSVEFESDQILMKGTSSIDVSYSGSSTTVTQGDDSYTVAGNAVRVVLAGDITSTSGPAISIGDNCNVTLVVTGDRTLVGHSNSDGILVSAGATLTITGNGSLTVRGNNGSDSSGAGSGIGNVSGSSSATIIISNLRELNAYGYGTHAYGIGGKDFTVRIVDSHIDTVQGGHYGETSGTAEGGPAIGGSRIYIVRSTIDYALGGRYCPAIGSLYDSTPLLGQNACIIEISSGSSVNVTGGQYAAGLGTAYGRSHITGFVDGTSTCTATARDATMTTLDNSHTVAQDIGYGVLSGGVIAATYFYIVFSPIAVPATPS